MEESMTTLHVRSVFRATLTLAIAGAMAGCSMELGEATGSQEQALSAGCAPTVPPALAVPDGNKLAFHLDALGVQIYACNGTAWVLQAPEARLLDKHGRVVGTHFLGPTWQYKDGSKVVGSKLAGVVVDATAIPWLLLGAVSHEGDGRMADITFIQRLDTAGGLAPTTGCDADHVGTVARVDYAATYFFYKAREEHLDQDD